MKICLVGIDGLRLDVAAENDAAPTLFSLAESGRHTTLRTEVPTISGPSWSTLLTGSSYSEHGISDNSFVGSRLAGYPDLLSQAYYAYRSSTFAAAGWPALVDPGDVGPVIFERKEQQRAGVHRVIVRDGETYGYQTVDAELVDFTVAALASDGPDMSFIYMCDTDDSAHIYGARSAEYVAAIRRVDAHLARIRATIERRVELTGEDWMLVVTTDHGHLDEGGHGGDSAEETASFVVAHRFGNDVEGWPEDLHPTGLTPLLLSYLA